MHMNQLMSIAMWPVADLFDEIARDRARHIFQDGPIATTETASANTLADTPLWQGLDVSSDTTESYQKNGLIKPTGNMEPINLTDVETVFAPGGVLSQAMPIYEQRPAQVAMARSVAQAFNTGQPLIVEAGTGTGKSMAYLVPSALFAVQRGERVVISTNTINLQDQLFHKDIPDVQRIMGQAGPEAQATESPADTFTAALLKGRSNYLCLRRYKQIRPDQALSPEDARGLLKVMIWLPDTRTGDRDELMLVDTEQRIWSRVNVTPDTCTAHRCPDFHDCFFFRARRRAEQSHLIVVNHALLLADLATPSQVLPDYDHLVVDEAHNLEEVATRQLSFSVDQAGLLTFLDSLYQEDGPTLAGLLTELPTSFQQGVIAAHLMARMEQTRKALFPSIERARTATRDCFQAFQAMGVRENSEQTAQRSTDRVYDERLRVTPGIRRKPAWANIEQVWENLNLILSQVGDGLNQLETLLVEDIKRDDLLDYDSLLLRIQWLKRYATDVRVQVGHIIFGNDEGIFWITYDHVRGTITLNSSPLEVGELLQSQLFGQKSTSVLTSATLSISDSFTFVKERLGFEEATELQLESPFDYEQQAMLYIPNDIPEPNQKGYAQMVEDALIQLCSATGGRTLALFTATSALRQTYSGIQEALEEREIMVLGQSIDGSRRVLLERFKANPRTVLLGTSSFWEGIDVTGDALSVLVITKLPFNVPTDPVFAARSEQLTDPFQEYAIPLSILRFKQGFGRLIRSKEDRGIVVVLDKRLITKQYGQRFLESLPSTRVHTGALRQLPRLAARFLEQRNDS